MGRSSRVLRGRGARLVGLLAGPVAAVAAARASAPSAMEPPSPPCLTDAWRRPTWHATVVAPDLEARTLSVYTGRAARGTVALDENADGLAAPPTPVPSAVGTSIHVGDARIGRDRARSGWFEDVAIGATT